MIYLENTMLKGFPCIAGNKPRILILGSMPSTKSLEQKEYYAHSSNRFWRLLSDLYGVTFTDYQSKKNFLKTGGIALWDVVDSCERQGSLDSDIKNVVANDIRALLKKHPTITHIYCNGRKAYALLNRHFPKLDVKVVSLPSSSNANQTTSYEELMKKWETIKRGNTDE